MAPVTVFEWNLSQGGHIKSRGSEAAVMYVSNLSYYTTVYLPRWRQPSPGGGPL